MSSYPLVKYVDAPTTSAVVRYDFNDQNPNPPTNPVKKVTEFDPGVPTLEGDPDAVGQQWGFRSPQIVHTIKGTKAQAMAALSAVSKEQLRRTNWVLFKPSAAQQAVWFKTYRTGYQPITLEQVWIRPDGGGQVAVPDTWKITVPLVADAFAYGARETVSPATITQAPSGVNAMRLVLPTIKGDAPTALRVTISPSGGLANNVTTTSQWLLGCIAGTSAMTDPVIDIGTGDTVTNISGTGAPVADATYFDGEYRVVTIGAATPNLLQRFSITVPNTVAPGRYKCLLRCQYTAAAAKTLLFRVEQWPNGSGAAPARGQTATVDTTSTDSGRAFWADLGDITLPFGINPATDAGGTMPTSTLVIDIGTINGTSSSVNVDSIKLIPVDGAAVIRTTLLKTYGPLTGAASSSVYGSFDGDLETYWAKSNTGIYVESSPVLRGYFPIADPAAAQNVLIVMALDSGIGSASGTQYITALGATSTVDVSYMPRFLHVGDGT